jgi:hypothetical protein
MIISTFITKERGVINMKTKTHYRNVFKSDHLGKADLEDFIESGKPTIFTIEYVRQEFGAKVAGKKIDANIAYFKEGIKPMVLNAGNSKIISGFAGSVHVENWNDITVHLYIDPDAKLKGERVGGVRISPKRVNTAKPVLTKENVKMWENAKKSFNEHGNFDKVLARMDLSIENQKLMMEEINNA